MKPKKSLGQNFLKSGPALKKIIEAGEMNKDDVVLEIGPGRGALTEKLLEHAGKVIAVEKDYALFEFLKVKFEKEIETGTLALACEDILDFKIKSLGGLASKYKIIANIPYNITGAILKKFLTAENQPTTMVLMVQHEVARRIVGKGSNPSTSLRVKESILSISVKAYGEPRLIIKVPARYFSPSPKVDSAVIVIKNISRKFFKENLINEEKFWEIVRAGFAHKRKKLSNNLKALGLAGFIPFGGKRAENLKLEEWVKLCSLREKNPS